MKWWGIIYSSHIVRDILKWLGLRKDHCELKIKVLQDVIWNWIIQILGTLVYHITFSLEKRQKKQILVYICNMIQIQWNWSTLGLLWNDQPTIKPSNTFLKGCKKKKKRMILTYGNMALLGHNEYLWKKNIIVFHAHP